MLQHPAAVRAAFEEGAATLLRALRAVTPEYWDRPGALGEWTTRELTAHALRAFITVEAYLTAEPANDRVLADAAEYYSTVLSDPTAHQGVAVRGRQAGRQLIDPVGEAEATTERVLAQIAATADDEPVNTFAGQITLIEYLATRVVELGVHTLDIQRATGQFAELHRDTSSVVLAVLVQLAAPVPVILALSGRAPLPDNFNVLG
ncbi:MAG TPA: maleylpyruvate isomerase N-terminal domain-containing protein [Ilumatobacteraceae bacterium]|nr:maleylpyruvate isomerase N-terminal domain-containing protein [Ilumatobacteraceae bacterium]HRB01841.1 maleylpyruvate isomerase N-terminal domain-containing protein [Ilumatobacteraceae bacterium]